MSNAPPTPDPARIRREPPRFRRVEVSRAEPVTPRLVRITLTGPELAGFAVSEPAASVRLLLPASDPADLVLPAWNGNEFLLAGGRRPTIRTFTPLRVDPDAFELDIEAVVHGNGIASRWALSAAVGTPAAISGPGRGYTIDRAAPAFLLAGDESALPAIRQLLAALPAATPTRILVEVARPDARLELGAHRSLAVEWLDLDAGAPPGDALVAAVRATALDAGTRVWAAGEAAAVQRIRKHLFEERGIPRAHTTIRGYWKHGRAAGDDTPANE